MANIRLLRRRIKTAKNIAQITRAMEMVAASKMRRAQEASLSGKPYAAKLSKMAQNLIGRTEVQHPYLAQRKTGKTLLILFSSDKGLCGSFNTNLLREFARFTSERKDVEAIAIGKKLERAVFRRVTSLFASFPFGTALPRFETVLPLAKIIVEGFTKGAYKEVACMYSEFISLSSQRPVIRTLLPIKQEESELPQEQLAGSPYLFEPSAGILLTYLLPHYLEMSLYQMFLESYASEQAARMIAMREATDNANEVIGELSLSYNKARQERITNELLDIVGGSRLLWQEKEY